MKMKTIVVLLFFAVAIFGIIAPINAVESSVSSEDKVYSIESKKKAASLKITWNANGGKIGSKKTVTTTVTKGSKINKLASSPKRTGYTFKGWYTAKTGGTKITKNTKVTKEVTYYAKWMKKASTNPNSAIEGAWIFESNYGTTNKYSYFFSFKNDGTFFYSYKEGSRTTITTGKYKVSNEKIYYSNILYNNHTMYKDTVSEYKFGKDTVGKYLLMPSFKYDESYVEITRGVKFRKF